jgi:hypothetical protein
MTELVAGVSIRFRGVFWDGAALDSAAVLGSEAW